MSVVTPETRIIQSGCILC